MRKSVDFSRARIGGGGKGKGPIIGLENISSSNHRYAILSRCYSCDVIGGFEDRWGWSRLSLGFNIFRMLLSLMQSAYLAYMKIVSRSLASFQNSLCINHSYIKQRFPPFQMTLFYKNKSRRDSLENFHSKEIGASAIHKILINLPSLRMSFLDAIRSHTQASF